MSKSNSEKGAIYILAAAVIPVILLIAGVSFAFYAETAAREQVEGSLRLVLLGVAERYYATECNPNSSVQACHETKLSAAVDRAEELREKNSKALGTLNISTGSDTGPGKASLVPGKYYFKEPKDEDPCDSSYPCFKPSLSSAEIANSFYLKGTVNKNSLLDTIFGLFGQRFSKNERAFELKVAAIPMRMCAVIDISASIGYDTHQRNQAYSAYPMEQTGGNPYDIKSEYDPYWNSMQASRPVSGATSPHYQSDYSEVASYDDSERGYLAFKAEYPNNDNHPLPPSEETTCKNVTGICCGAGEYANICRKDSKYDNNLIVPPPHYMTDLYRSAEYTGPEPFLSILRGVHMAIESIKARKVAGDRACLILYNDVLDWRHVVKLTDDFDYLLEVLNPVEISNIAQMNSPTWLNDQSAAPKWLQLGIFPIPGRNTFTSIAFTEAVSQFAEDKFRVPSVDFVTHFSDGLPNCYINDEGEKVCNAVMYEAYRKAMLQIEKIVYEGFFKSKTALHMFITGDSVGPHSILKPSPVNASKCLTDEEARISNPTVDYVKGQGLDLDDETDPDGQGLFQYSYADPPTPFYQANLDWYRMVRMTGGRWSPLRKNPANCAPVTDCNGTDGTQRLLQDPECRGTSQQVEDELKAVLSESAGFVVVK